MCNIFVKSYEDNTYIGRNVVMGRLIDKITKGSPFPKMAFGDIMETLKECGVGDFMFFETKEELLDATEDAIIIDEKHTIYKVMK